MVRKVSFFNKSLIFYSHPSLTSDSFEGPKTYLTHFSKTKLMKHLFLNLAFYEF